METKSATAASGRSAARSATAKPTLPASPSLLRSLLSPKAARATPPVALERNFLPERHLWAAKDERDADSESRSSKEERDDDAFDRLSKQSAERLRQVIMEIDAEGSRDNRWLPGEWRTGAFVVGVTALSLMALDPGSKALAYEMHETASLGQQGGLLEGLSSQSGFLAFVPIVCYLLLVVYTKSSNTKLRLF